MPIPLQFASLYDDQEVFVWSDCLLDLGMEFLIGNMVFVNLVNLQNTFTVGAHSLLMRDISCNQMRHITFI